ncbi:hypothetical protein ALC57_18610 [Trachymyrmex cornetzi]|uniref:Uncharacterized protein n=1 Tax=Trachymyrmex cornetzi TaxID=471704 RepID=A0A151IRJ0_9HYME|nr:hypothetical protein ALC57_18610 [Trachymyrmex cornetzi]
MRSQKLEHSNADLSLISMEKLTIHRYVGTVEMFYRNSELCITVPETTVFSEYASFTQDVNETDVLQAQRP